MGIRSLKKGGGLSREVWHNNCLWYKNDDKNIKAEEEKPLLRGLGACLPENFGFLHCF